MAWGRCGRGCCTLALTLSLLLQQKQFHAPPHIHTNSHTHAQHQGCIHLFIHSFNQLFIEHLLYASPYFRHRGHTEAKILALTELIF